MREKMRPLHVAIFAFLLVLTLMTKCTAHSKLSLWIDGAQVQAIAGFNLELHIINKGEVTTYLSEEGFEESLPTLPPEIDTVNLTWEAGDELFHYWFDTLVSNNKTILYNPLLSIPASGIIPKGPTIFQMSIPCTGSKKGIAHLVLGLRIWDSKKTKTIRGSPLKLKLKKECHQFETTNLCKKPCQNNGRCNSLGVCECRQGFQGDFCEEDMCFPKCENNGTCISRNICICLDGFSGKYCENALCARPCQNGGRCIPAQEYGVCLCTNGSYGEACEYRADRTRRRAHDDRRRRKKCEIKWDKFKQKCGKIKTCKSKEERITKKCKNQSTKQLKRCKKRQTRLANRCLKKYRERRDRCTKKDKQCSLKHRKRDRKKKKKT